MIYAVCREPLLIELHKYRTRIDETRIDVSA